MKARSPFVWAVLAALAVFAAAFAPVLLDMLLPLRTPVAPGPARSPAAGDPPWRIERAGPAAWRALGVTLPGSTLAEVRSMWVDDFQLAVVASPGRPPALEAYVERWRGGGVSGRLVLVGAATSAEIERWQQRSPRREPMEGDTWRWRLHADDQDAALRKPVVGLSFVPSARLDADSLLARFGEPAQRLQGEGSLRHWLYPDRGLAIGWDESAGRAVIQMVATSDFDARLRAPLLSAPAQPASSAAKP